MSHSSRAQQAICAATHIHQYALLLICLILQSQNIWHDLIMNNLSGLIIAALVLIWLPTQAQATVTKQDKKVLHSSSTAKLKAGGVFLDCSGCPQMVVVPAGSYEMGSPKTEAGRGKDESPVHLVNVSTFAMGSTEITREQFAAFVKKTHYKAGEKCWIFENGKFEDRDVKIGRAHV